MLELDKIYCGDCLELMKQLNDESVDCVVTSPPYNLGIMKKGSFYSGKQNKGNTLEYLDHNDDMDENKYIEWQKKVLNECYRVIKKTGAIPNHPDN